MARRFAKKQGEPPVRQISARVPRSNLYTMTIVVTAKPGSKRPGLSVSGAAIEIRVAAPARDGLANAAVHEMLARALGLPKRALRLVRGASARTKAFEVDGLERAAILERLRARNGG